MDQSLRQLPLLDFFEGEISPVLIFDIEGHSLVYENRAFQDWKLASPRESLPFTQPAFLDQVRDWSKTASSPELAISGKTWRAQALRKRWLVLMSNERNLATVAHGQTVPPTPPATATYSSMFCATEPPNVARRCSDRCSPAPSFSSATSGMDTACPIQKPLDWTKYHVPTLSAHVQSLKSYPWDATSIGGMDTWSETLRSTVIALAANPEPRILLWGPDHVLIPNEACAPVLGEKFPMSIGGKGEDVWSEAWPALSGFISCTEAEAKANRIPGMPLTMERHGYEEETFWIINFVPIMGPNGQVAGVLDEFTEITQSVVQDRRRDVVLKTGEAVLKTNTLEELWDAFLRSVEAASSDIPYAAIYTPLGSSHANPRGDNSPSGPLHRFSLRGSSGLHERASQFSSSFDLFGTEIHDDKFLGAFKKACRTGEVTVLRDEDGSLPSCFAVGPPGRASGSTVKTACVIPVPDLMSNNQLAYVVIGITPRRPFDDSATALIGSLSNILTRAASAIFLPDEQRRARQRFEEIETALSQQLKSASIEAEKAEARYEKILKSAQVGMYIIDAHEKLLYYNDAYLVCTGATKAQADSNDVPATLIHEDDAERVYKLWYRCIKDRAPLTSEYRLKKPWKSVDSATGKEITGDTWIMAAAAPELDDQGNVIHVIGWMLDISERKYHERQHIQRLEQEQAEIRFARLAETAPMGMYLLKPDGTPIYLNDAYYEILGFTKESFADATKRGVGWAEVIMDEDANIVTDAWEKLSKHGTPINIEYRVKKPWKAYNSATKTEMSGPTWLQGTAFAEKDDAGHVVAVQGFVTDISLKKFSERLLTERLEEALETKRSADRFIDMVSHEMRNPLSAILQSADGIMEALNVDDKSRSQSLGAITAMKTEAFETVLDSAQTIMLCAQHQKRIVDDILTLSKLDSNLLVISPDKTDLPGLINKCFKMYEGELERAEIDASLVIERGYNELGVTSVMIDSSRVLQVIINLLTNAIKFTQHSVKRQIKIYLNASMTKPERNSHNTPWIEPRANRPDHTSQTEWGTGETVYLTIAVSDTGRGLNEQELKLLFHRFSQASPKTYKQYGGSGLGLFISRELTELQGGQIGVSSEAGKGSVFAFYVQARRSPDADSTPVSIVTSATSSRSPSPQVDSGPKKPSSPPTLHALQRRASMSFRRGSAAPPKVITKPRSGLHVLVVEDNEINRRVMASQLRRLGCTVYLAGNGVEALHFLESTDLWHTNVYSVEAVVVAPSLSSSSSSSATSGPPVPLSCILMDLEMPVLGGLGCVKKIRELQTLGQLVRHVPTIAVTANARSEQIASAVRSGMDSVVTKPFKVGDILPVMDELVRKLDPDRRR